MGFTNTALLHVFFGMFHLNMKDIISNNIKFQ